MIYLTEPVDEYCIQALPEFDGKRFQNVAKEGVKFEESEKSKESREALEKEFEPLLNWMKDKALKDKVQMSCGFVITICNICKFRSKVQCLVNSWDIELTVRSFLWVNSHVYLPKVSA